MSASLAAVRQPEPSDDLAADLEPLRETSRVGKHNLRSVGLGEQTTAGRGAEPRDNRGAADLSRAQRTFELLRTQVTRLETATARRDFTDARALASSIRTTVPSLTAAIERARKHGADAAALAAVEKRAADLVPRLEAAMQRAPENARGLGFDLLDPSTEEKLEARWLAKLDGAADDPMARSAATAFGGAKAQASSAPASGRTVMPSHDAFEAAADHRISALVKAGRPLAAPAYLHFNMRDLRVELGAFLAAHLASTGHAQVAFTDGPGAFVTQLLAELRPADASACVTMLGQWLTPAELYAIADRNRAILQRPEKDGEINYERGPKGPATWSPAVASAIGAALLGKLVELLPKMSQRLVAISTVEAASAAKDGSAEGGDGDAESGASRLSVRDFGALPPLEQQIARALLGRRGSPSVSVSAAPSTAAPASPKTRAATSSRRNRSQKPTASTSSAAASAENASAAERGATTNASVVRQWGAIDEDLKALSFKLGFAAELAPAKIAHVQKRIDLESLAGRDLQMRATAFTKQQELLAAILVAAKPLLERAEPPDARGPTPVRDSLRWLAKAAGHSHLPSTARRYLSRARHTQRDQAFTSLEALCGQISTRLELAHQLAETSRGRTRYSAHLLGKSLQVRHEEALAELAAIRGAAVGSGALDPQRLQALYARLDKLHFEASLISNVGAVGQMFQIFDELENDRWVLFSEGIRWSGEDDVHFGEHGNNKDGGSLSLLESFRRGGSIGRLEALRRGASTLRGALTTLHSRWLKIERLAQMLEQGGAGESVQRPATGLMARAAQATVEKEFAEIRRVLALIGGDAQVAAFLNEAHQTAKSAQRRALCVQIAAMIGVALASSGIAAAATGAATGLGAGAMTAQLAGVAAESLAFSALNARLNATPFGAELLTNFAGNLATFGAMSGAKAFTQAKLADSLAAGGRRALAAKLADFTATALTAAAVQFAQAQVTQLAQRGRVLSEEELAQTLVQGLAMAIGQGVLGMTKSLERAKGNLARSLTARRELKALARQVAKTGDPAQAMKLLADLRIQLEIERAHWTEMQRLPSDKLKERGLTREHTDDMAAHSSRHLANLDKLEGNTLLAQLGLDPVVPGQVYAGDAPSVARVRDAYLAKGYTVEKHGDAGEYSVSELGEPPLRLIERAPTNAARKKNSGTKDPKKREPSVRSREVNGDDFRNFHRSYQHDGASSTPLSYDHQTRTISFEGEANGIRLRYETRLPAPILKLADWDQPNRIVGTRVLKDHEAARRILRMISAGKLEVLRELGVEVPPDLMTKIDRGLEFGLGKLADDSYVIIRGERNCVTWPDIPGLEGLAHSHASTPGNDLSGSGRFTLQELVAKQASPNNDQLKVLPSGSDITFSSINQIQSHQVFTPFVVQDGFVMKPDPDWQGDARLEIRIEQPRKIGYTEPETSIHQATLVGLFEGKEVFLTEGYAAWNKESGNLGHLALTPPTTMTRTER